MIKQIIEYIVIKRSGLFNKDFYTTTYQDIVPTKIDPLMHFIRFGWTELRNPSSAFNTKYYLDANPDVKKSRRNPLVHYIKFGKDEGRKPTPNFERAENANDNFFGDDNKFTLNSKAMKNPKRLLRNFKRKFISGWTYFRRYGAIKFGKRALNKLADRFQKYSLNWVRRTSFEQNYFELLYSQKMDIASGIKNSDYVDYRSHVGEDGKERIKAIAFYLPQFHPIPENDKWWGRGFTEWTNVSKAIPQFVGHYQPRLPGELGFYDLRVPEIQQRQVELARNYGIYGFCFYYYWFAGKRLLEKPLDQFVSNPKIDFPFCICWANENWTRTWDGLQNDILIGQTHSFENDKRFIEDISPLLRNDKYIKIDGRPLILVYRASLLEEPKIISEYWREYCLNNGLGNPYLVTTKAFGFSDPISIGFDALAEFPPLNIPYESINRTIKFLNKNYSGYVYDYLELLKKNIDPVMSEYRLFRGVTPSWDNESRKPGRGNSFINSTPKLYQRWLEQISYEERNNYPRDENLVFINAWNEWAEGAYLEPDRKFGYAYLEATYNAISQSAGVVFRTKDGMLSAKPKKNNSIAVIIHAYYLDLLEEVSEWLRNIGEDVDLYISLPKEKESEIRRIFDLFPNSYVICTENRGRDIYPFLLIYRCIVNDGYDSILKIHTKKSAHRTDGDLWRNDIYEKLLSRKSIEIVQRAFKKYPRLGIIGPKGHVLSNAIYWGSNKETVMELAKSVGIKQINNFEFVAGSMFWAKPEALRLLNLLPVSIEDFEPEPIPPDGALPHGIERLIGLAAIAQGYEIKSISLTGKLTSVPNNTGSYKFA